MLDGNDFTVIIGDDENWIHYNDDDGDDDDGDGGDVDGGDDDHLKLTSTSSS